MSQPWRTTGIQWHCLRPDGTECGGRLSEDIHNPDRTFDVWREAKKHAELNPTGHKVVIERFQRIDIRGGR